MFKCIAQTALLRLLTVPQRIVVVSNIVVRKFLVALSSLGSAPPTPWPNNLRQFSRDPEKVSFTVSMHVTINRFLAVPKSGDLVTPQYVYIRSVPHRTPDREAVLSTAYP